MRSSKARLSLLLIVLVSFMCFTNAVHALPVNGSDQPSPQANSRAPKPIPTFPSGMTLMLGTKISLQTSAQGGEIHYTTDGTDPTVTSSSGRIVSVEGEPGETFTLKAVTIKAGLQTSETAVLTYPISAKLPLPTASLPSGSTLKRGSSISVASNVPNADAEYTLDGTSPDFTTSLRDSSKIVFMQNHGDVVTVKAASHYGPFYKDGKRIEAYSEVATFIYFIDGTSPTPAASYPTGSIVANNTIVELSNDGAFNETYYYTTDGSTPTSSGPSGRFILIAGKLGQKVTVKAIAKTTGTGWLRSPVAVFDYTIGLPAAEPTVKLIDELLTQTTATVRFQSDTPEATIHFRAFKEVGGFAYTSAEMIGTSGTFERKPNEQLYIEAFAEKEGMARSHAKRFYFTLPDQLEEPIADDADCKVVPNNAFVTLRSSDPEARIHYTTDGSEPTRTSAIAVMGQIQIKGAPGTLVRVKAIALKSGKMPSAVASFEYVLQ
ncbi:chitobiase/beta-hexosaminidase C-terminal domain-containing protein [Paenibacillus silvisoli]|uniref:chitobiase/beta-hexosaminidase C-terminal domain-containing protein n=1 Tax=Paenibacillus silvisoli TaxID=3110539 RepID=UPI0028048A03|nr:chitobiase/beta-hexosaminidase C-terminal domain-containing protein [Paenibacillus silvisoli]